MCRGAYYQGIDIPNCMKNSGTGSKRYAGVSCAVWPCPIFSWQLNSYPCFQASTEVFSYWAAQILEDLHFTAIDREPDVQCKNSYLDAPDTHFHNTLMFLQWCLGRKIEIRNIMTAKTKKKKIQTECSEMERNPSKDWAMHEGDDLLFWNEFIWQLYSSGDTWFYLRICRTSVLPYTRFCICHLD
jgi:hypothetical protein